MELSNLEVVNLYNVISSFANKEGLPIKCSFALANNLKKLEEIINVADIERKKIIKKYAVIDDKTGELKKENNELIFKSNDDKLKCIKDINELDSITSKVELTQINLTDLEAIKPSINVIKNLQAILKEEKN